MNMCASNTSPIDPSVLLTIGAAITRWALGEFEQVVRVDSVLFALLVLVATVRFGELE